MTDIIQPTVVGKIQNQISAPLFTAIPIGVHAWTVKAISPSGEQTTVGRFDGRLHALGAAVLLAAKAEGRVLP